LAKHWLLPAATTRFGERIAHGQLVLAIGGALSLRPGVAQSMPESFIAFYGMDRLRFTHPVRIGDTIHFESTVTSIDFKDEKTGIMVREGRILNQDGELCCSFVSRALCGRRPSSQAVGAEADD
jgi:3-hydroxybutyryl-CoA dehydratase